MPFARLSRQTIHAIGFGLEQVVPFGHQTVLFPFVRHNWVDEFLVETSWSTHVSVSDEDQTEERLALWDRPQRSVFLRLNGSRLIAEEASRNYIHMMKHGQQTLPAPITADRTRMLQTAGTGTIDIVCDTVYRRFFPGMRVAFVNPSYDPIEVQNVTTDAYTAQIANMTPTGFQLTEALLNTIPERWLIFPLMDVEPLFTSGGTTLSDRFSSYNVEFLELPGSSSIPSAWPLGSDIESKYRYFLGRPIFPFRPDSVNNPRIQYTRAGGRTGIGRGSYFYTRGERPFLNQDFLVTHKTREESWRMLEFMDWARGRLNTFWMRNAHIYWRAEDGVITSTANSNITCETFFTRLEIEEFFKYLWIQYTDGAQQVIEVNNITGGVGDRAVTFNFNGGLFKPFDQVKFVTTAHVMRNTQDVFKQSWITDSVSTSYISVREVLDETLNVAVS